VVANKASACPPVHRPLTSACPVVPADSSLAHAPLF
jgi:hypothetical protein